MDDEQTPSVARGCERAHFPLTQWSMVLAIRSEEDERIRPALEELCKAYWFPVYAFIRRRCNSKEEAEDLTQDFFRHLIGSQRLEAADPARGRFRGYLAAILRSFLSHEREKSLAQKRGGGFTLEPMDLRLANERYCREIIDPVATPEKAFDRAWTLNLMGRVVDSIETEYIATGKGAHFRRMRVFVWGDNEGSSYEAVAKELGMTAGAVKVSIHRLRQKVGERLRREVASTLENPADTDEEIRILLASLGNDLVRLT